MLTKFGTCGSSCIVWPMPWPTNFSTTYRPWLLTNRSIRLATSSQVLQRPIARMARLRVSDVTSSSFCTSGRTGPIARVTAASPHQPLTLHPVSIETMSPSRSGRRFGMPCTTCSFTLAQITAGKGWLSLGRAGIAQKQRSRLMFAKDRGDGVIHVGGASPRARPSGAPGRVPWRRPGPPRASGRSLAGS